MSYLSKVANFFSTPHVFGAAFWGSLLEFHRYRSHQKTRLPDLLSGVSCTMINLDVLIELRLVTDRRTDRQTDSHGDIAHTAPSTWCCVLKTKKLSYHRGTAQRSMLVSSCYVSLGMAVRQVTISKSDLQGHSAPLKLRPYGAIQMCILLLLLFKGTDTGAIR